MMEDLHLSFKITQFFLLLNTLLENTGKKVRLPKYYQICKYLMILALKGKNRTGQKCHI
jgi:hypothetical protein